MSKFITADCPCGWSLWREGGFTRHEASEAYWHQVRTDCPTSAWARVE
jgi:hypothetical protein